MIAAVISIPSDSHNIKPSTVHQQHPCGISGLGIQGFQLLLKFYKIFLSVVIKLMLTHVLLAGWVNTLACHFMIPLHRHIFPFS